MNLTDYPEATRQLPLVVAVGDIERADASAPRDTATGSAGAAPLSVLLFPDARRCAAEHECRSFSSASQVTHSPQIPEPEKD
jgi:hypothetical protein